MTGIDISQLSSVTEDTLPLIWVILSVLVTGNIIRLVLFLDNAKGFFEALAETMKEQSFFVGKGIGSAFTDNDNSLIRI